MYVSKPLKSQESVILMHLKHRLHLGLSQGLGSQFSPEKTTMESIFDFISLANHA